MKGRMLELLVRWSRTMGYWGVVVDIARGTVGVLEMRRDYYATVVYFVVEGRSQEPFHVFSHNRQDAMIRKL